MTALALKRHGPRPTCERCGIAITGRGNRRRRFCSVACFNATPGARPGRSTNRLMKTCPGCGEDFSVPVSNAARYRYCSKRCSTDHRGRDATCARCGSAFRHSQTQARRYCCETCRRPPAEKACEGCGTTYRVEPAKTATRRYCSTHCYRASGAETGIERTIRELLQAWGYDFTAQAMIGPWVVDFRLDRLVIEADGDYWHSLRPAVDARKSADLRSRGYDVWRIQERKITRDDFAEHFRARLASYWTLGAASG